MVAHLLINCQLSEACSVGVDEGNAPAGLFEIPIDIERGPKDKLLAVVCPLWIALVIAVCFEKYEVCPIRVDDIDRCPATGVTI